VTERFIVPRVKIPPKAYLSLIAVYLIWGSTWLAMRIAVRAGSGFPPFSVGATRLAVAGVILLVICRLVGKNIKINWGEALILATSGILIWVGANGLALWAEQFIESSYAALIFGLIPIWTALFQAILNKKGFSKRLLFSLTASILGLFLLLKNSLTLGDGSLLIPSIILVFGSINWTCGTLIQKRFSYRQGILVSSAYQQIFGAIGFTFVSLVLNEPFPNPSTEALLAWGYLLIFGSLGFSCYVAAVRYLPTNISSTFAYICPIIAVILGRLILNEPITLLKLGGMGFILVGVYGIFRDQNKKLA
jgi:drug/metabolite transporter (DMT)-like permease